MASPDIFLSYSREDIQVAQKFANALQKVGFSVWWDQAIRSGETYDQVTEDALRAAKAVVVLWSSRSVRSRWVRSEATIALRQNTFVPVMIEQCDRPVMFELNQANDLSGWKGNSNDKSWRALLDDIGEKLACEVGAVNRTGPSPNGSKALDAGFLSRWKIASLFVGLVAMAGAGYVLYSQSASAQSSRTAVFAFEVPASDPAAKQLADATRQDLFVQLNDANIETLARSKTDEVPTNQQSTLAREMDADYAVRGKITKSDSGYSFNLTIEDVPAGENLWEQTLTASLSDQKQLIIRASDTVHGVLTCFDGGRPHLKSGSEAEFEILRKYCTYDARVDPHTGFLQRARDLSNVSTDTAPIHFGLAMNLISALNFGTKEESAAAHQEMTTLAQKMERTQDGEYGAATIRAEIALFKSESIEKQMVLLERGSRGSKFGFSKKGYASKLAELGMIGTAVRVAKEGVKLAPGNPGIRRLYARLLAVNGQVSESSAAASYSLDRYATTQAWEFAVIDSVLLNSGDSAAFLRARPITVSNETYRCMKHFAEGVKLSDQDIFDCESAMVFTSYEIIYALKYKDTKSVIDLYKKYANTKNSAAFHIEYFYSKQAAHIRNDPQLPTLFQSLGYVDYWKATKTLPDLCYSPAEERGSFCTSLRRITGQTD